MLPGMRRPSTSILWSRVIALPLALWSTVPGIQWCRVGWAEVRLECFAACSIEKSDCPPGRCGPGAAPAQKCPEAPDTCTPPRCGMGDIPATGCPAGVSACALDPCGPVGDTTDGLPGGRAYCLSGPSGGDGVPPIQPDAGHPMAVLPPTRATATPDTGAERPQVFAVASPPVPATGAVPRIRAPPLNGPTLG